MKDETHNKFVSYIMLRYKNSIFSHLDKPSKEANEDEIWEFMTRNAARFVAYDSILESFGDNMKHLSDEDVEYLISKDIVGFIYDEYLSSMCNLSDIGEFAVSCVEDILEKRDEDKK